MFIVQGKPNPSAKKMSILMGILFVLMGAFGALLTMHIYVRPPPLPPPPRKEPPPLQHNELL